MKTADRIRSKLKRIQLFSKIVFRIWDKQGSYIIRIYPKTAWTVAGIIHK